MTVIIFLIISLTIAELFVCHVTLWWFVALICRTLFCLRAIGTTFKVKKLAIGEGIGLSLMLIWRLIFKGDTFPWVNFLLILGFTALVLLLEFVDELFYVYTIEDDDTTDGGI